MIIIRLKGGLGNQMFQYAAARNLSFAYNTSLKLDLTWFENTFDADSQRKYMLDKLSIEADIAEQALLLELTKYHTNERVGFIRNAIKTVFKNYQQSYVDERTYFNVPDIYRTQGRVYLDGYWQSEKYFSKIDKIIRDEFTVKNQPDVVNNNMQENILSTLSVSVHVRRGDYVHNPVTNRHHGICELDYYYKAMDAIYCRVKSPHFFVFSDDPVWVRSYLRPSYPFTVVDHNGADQPHEDLRLISMCKHHIIANSSLSWWGAWLCCNNNKMVIAPEKWFNDKNRDISELLPNTWLTL